MLIPKDCKRLAEVDFPIAEVSKHAAREKSGPSGHPSRVHMWWARRPLASCRSVLLCLVLPDPCDPLCPEQFKSQARAHLEHIQRVGATDEGLRRALLKFVGAFANWNASADSTFLAVGRGLVHAAYPDDSPLVVDPFAGGGSIPLEALRLRCETFASDLNPVAALILKVLLEDIPRFGSGLSAELLQSGARAKQIAKSEMAEFYPPGADGGSPIVYLWARTVRCESPNCGAEIPIYRSGWLSKKGASRARYFLEAEDGTCIALLIESAPLGGPIRFRIATGHGNEDPLSGYISLRGTKSPGNNANVTCPCCGSTLPGNRKNPRVPTQLSSQRGGADVVFDGKGRRTGGAYLLAIVTTKAGERGRQFRLPSERDYDAVWKAQSQLKSLAAGVSLDGLSVVPDETTPTGGGSGAGRAFSVQRYGMLQWGDLFTARQKLVLATFVEILKQVGTDNPTIKGLLACAFNRVVMSDMSCTRWNAVAEKMQHTFGRQALPMVWDFAEVVPTADAPGNWESGYALIGEVIDKWRDGTGIGQVQVADARESPLVSESADVWFTDPPYYDAVPYAELSDFFYVWLKRTLPGHPLLNDPFEPSNPLTPKIREIVQDETKQVDGRLKDRNLFEEAMGSAFREGRRVLKEDGIGCVVFAHKTTEGWEALLSGMIQGGWVITGSWPIATEMGSRLRARDSAALATSIHLVCRARPEDAEVGDWDSVLRELSPRVGEWIERLQGEGVRGADLVFACIGPALQIFSQYSRVETPAGHEIPLGGDPEAAEPHHRGYLAYVWETVGRIALEQVLGTDEAHVHNGGAGALEEDARLTALFLWTLQSTTSNGVSNGTSGDQDEDTDEEEGVAPRSPAGGLSLIYDVVRRFAQPLGIHLDDWEGSVINTDKGVVKLIPVVERAEQLFGREGAQAVADRIESERPGGQQLSLFLLADETEAPEVRGRGHRTRQPGGDSESLATRREATTLDRVHAAMLLQASGRTNALRALLRAEQDRGPYFLRLSNALAALYPAGTEEKRLVEAMLLAGPR